MSKLYLVSMGSGTVYTRRFQNGELLLGKEIDNISRPDLSFPTVCTHAHVIEVRANGFCYEFTGKFYQCELTKREDGSYYDKLIEQPVVVKV